MSLKHVVFIVNPRSGVERQKQVQAAIAATLDSTRYTWEIQHTEYAHHGIELARQAARAGAWAVIAVGGDGSVNDVATGLLGTNALLGIVPKGSGNGLARGLGIPLNAPGALQVINRGKDEPIDAAFVNGRTFLSNAGVAFDALIADKFAQSLRRGFIVYSWLVTRYLWLYRPLRWQITIDGQQIEEEAFMVIVANGPQFGYNFRIAPMASYNDGILDVIVVRKFPKILGALVALRAFNGTIASSRYVKHYTGKEITIENPSLAVMQTDGDPCKCTSPATFTITQKALRVLVP